MFGDRQPCTLYPLAHSEHALVAAVPEAARLSRRTHRSRLLRLRPPAPVERQPPLLGPRPHAWCSPFPGLAGFTGRGSGGGAAPPLQRNGQSGLAAWLGGGWVGACANTKAGNTRLLPLRNHDYLRPPAAEQEAADEGMTLGVHGTPPRARGTQGLHCFVCEMGSHFA